MKHLVHTNKASITKYSHFGRVGLVVLCMGLSACQQILDRLEADLKGTKPEPVTATVSQIEVQSEALAQPPQTKTKGQPLERNKVPLETPKSAVKPIDLPVQAAITKSQEHKPATTPAARTNAALTVTQTHKSSPAVESKRASAHQVQTIDEDGNPLGDSMGTKKSPRPRVYIED